MGIPYQSMSGDEDNNVAMQLDQDLKAKKINMVIVWGPIAGYIVGQGTKNAYSVIPMPRRQTPFEFAMAIIRDDKERQQTLNRLIAENKDRIKRIMKAITFR